jgi:hypothetical protein
LHTPRQSLKRCQQLPPIASVGIAKAVFGPAVVDGAAGSLLARYGVSQAAPHHVADAAVVFAPVAVAVAVAVAAPTVSAGNGGQD